MKKFLIPFVLTILAFNACTVRNSMSTGEMGYLSLTEMDLLMDTAVTVTRAAVSASGNYSIMVFDAEDNCVVNTTYVAVCQNDKKISLPEGSYTLVARSASDDVPAAAFENPVYGASKEFTIVPSKVTQLGTLVCRLLQTKVTVSYSDDFLKMVTGDGAATVSVSPESPLQYDLSYKSGGKASYNQSAGYFAVNNGDNTTMEVTFKGSVENKIQKMTKVFSNVKACTWHQIKFIKKVNEDGNADFDIVIDGFVDDKDLNNDVPGNETVIGDDPRAPQGDGGIELVSTCAYDINRPIEVPSLDESFVLTMQARIPGKVKKFTVEIKSSNSTFVEAVGDINLGSNVLDLVNPSDNTKEVFTTILPFPYGDAVYNKDVIDFNLSDAQKPLLGFEGEHEFIMHVVDQSGCKKDISIVMVVR